MARHITPAAQGAAVIPSDAAGVGRIGKILDPATAPYIAARRLVGSDVARSILPVTLDQPLRLPDDLEGMRAALVALPAAAELHQARGQIVDALSARATFPQIVAIVGAALDTRSAVSADRRGQITEGLTWHLKVEASLKHVSPYVLAGAMLKLTRETRFFPDVPEILAELDQTRTFLAIAVRSIDRLIEARDELADEIRIWEKVEADDRKRQARIARGEPVDEDLF